MTDGIFKRLDAALDSRGTQLFIPAQNPEELSAFEQLLFHILRHHVKTLGQTEEPKLTVIEETSDKRTVLFRSGEHEYLIKRNIAAPPSITGSLNGSNRAFPKRMLKHVLSHVYEEIFKHRKQVEGGYFITYASDIELSMGKYIFEALLMAHRVESPNDILPAKLKPFPKTKADTRIGVFVPHDIFICLQVFEPSPRSISGELPPHP